MILGGTLFETCKLIAEDNLALVDYEQGEYADGDPSARDLLGVGAVDADDGRAFSDDALKCDLNVFERALEFTHVRDESREIKRTAIRFLYVLGTEIASNRAFIELV